MPGAGLEPAWPFEVPRDFKSLVYTNFTIRAERWILRKVSFEGCGRRQGTSFLVKSPIHLRCRYTIRVKQWRDKDSAERPEREELEAGVGIEPAYTALQAAA